MDFVTRSWLKCPVESRADWEAMQRRYRAEDPARYPAEPAAQALRKRAFVGVPVVALAAYLVAFLS
jgi:hypothetical protein